MILTIKQIQLLKKEIENIWMYLDRLEKQAQTESPAHEEVSAGKTFKTESTLEMLERMSQKVATKAAEAELLDDDGSAKTDTEIDQALLKADVKNALQDLKKELGIH